MYSYYTNDKDHLLAMQMPSKAPLLSKSPKRTKEIPFSVIYPTPGNPFNGGWVHREDHQL